MMIILTPVNDINVLIGLGIQANVTLANNPQTQFNVYVGNDKLIESKFPNLLNNIDENYYIRPILYHMSLLTENIVDTLN